MKVQHLNNWQLGLAAFALSAIAGLSSRSSRKDERAVYTKELKQAPWAPPAWVFGPVWTLNNYFLLKGLQQLVKSDHPDKKTLMYMQLPIWAIFFSFGYVYFNKKSPVLAATWTVGDALLAAASFALAKQNDPSLAKKFLPLLSWTGFASTVAIYQALKNEDPVLETSPVI